MHKNLFTISLFFLVVSCKNFEIINPFNEIVVKKENTNLKSNKINYKNGIYHCKSCDTPLYNSKNNYDSNYNNESFYVAIENKVEFDENYKLSKEKTELNCKKCGKKLGNVWNDGPKPNGNRHCVTRNNIILKKLEIRK